MTANEIGPGLSGRLAHLRQAVFGPRGRAVFARAIGVSPSTYNYYEKGRAAPAELLARAAEVTGANLEWLLTGRGTAFPEPPSRAGDIGLSPQSTKILERFVAGSGAASESAAARAALKALLAQLEQTLPPPREAWQPSAFAPTPNSIPIIGRTAAGLLASWEKAFGGQEDADVLERLIRQVEGQAARRREGSLQPPDPQVEAAQPADRTAMVTQLSAPTAEGLVEFLEAPGIGRVPGGTFALRVDGDSMAPRIRDGDIVVSHRRAQPQPGQTAIVKVRGRVGVTVKLWRPEGEQVHLIPINASYELGVFRRRDILWACRVLWLVRL